eukprot:UN1257
MLRNIPCNLSLHRLEDAIVSMGFQHKYDFLRLTPTGRVNPKKIRNLGYGFINFFNPCDADAFIEKFSGFTFEATNSRKVGIAMPAKVQGFEAITTMLRDNRGPDGVMGEFTCSL